MDLYELINHFIWTLQCEKRISVNTLKSYTYDMRIFMRFLESEKYLLTDINLVEDFYFYLKERKKLLPTIIRKINLLISFLRFCKDEKGFNIDIPDRNNIRLDKIYRPFLENKDLDTLRSYLVEDSKKHVRLRFIIEVLYSTGLRISELLNMKLNDLIDIYSKLSLIIKGKGNVYRSVFFTERAIEAIKEYVVLFNPQIKLLKLTRQRVFQLLKELALEVGVDPSLMFPHTFRHRLLTNLLKNDMDLVSVQKIAGHKQISTTEKYTHVEEYLYDEILKYHPLMDELI